MESIQPAVRDQAHRVAAGETLWSISHRYGLSVEELARANGLSDRSRIEAGQRLAIPAAHQENWSTQEIRPPPPVGRPKEGDPPDSGTFVWPVQGRVISIFGTRRRGAVNKGIDIQARAGEEVVAARGGRISFVHPDLPGFGKTIIIEHGNDFASVYAYVSELLVRPGEWVAQRQPIARAGETGRAEVPALHFEIRKRQKPLNPLHYLP